MTEYSFILMASAIIGAISICRCKDDIRKKNQIEQLEKEMDLLKDRLEHINKVIKEIGAEDVSNKSE